MTFHGPSLAFHRHATIHQKLAGGTRDRKRSKAWAGAITTQSSQANSESGEFSPSGFVVAAPSALGSKSPSSLEAMGKVRAAPSP